MIPPVIPMHRLKSSHSGSHLGGHVKLPSKEFFDDFSQTLFYGALPLASLQGPPYGAPLWGPPCEGGPTPLGPPPRERLLAALTLQRLHSAWQAG